MDIEITSKLALTVYFGTIGFILLLLPLLYGAIPWFKEEMPTSEDATFLVLFMSTMLWPLILGGVTIALYFTQMHRFGKWLHSRHVNRGNGDLPEARTIND